MPSIEILGTGRVDERESAFPMAVQLPGGDLLCSFSVGDGQYARGGSDWARSTDGGRTWSLEGTILPKTESPHTTNALKLTLSPDGKRIYAYGSRAYRDTGEEFGDVRDEAVFCTSDDEGRTWSEARVVPMPVDCPLEISHGILPLSSGRLLAPTATLPSKERLGEQVIVAASDDGGETWPQHFVVFRDSSEKLGYFEQKLIELSPGRLMATAWTVTFGDVVDQTDSFAISEDDGATWGPAHSTGIRGQTLTPFSLGDDRLLGLYNRRYGEQGVVMCLGTGTDDRWTIHHEGLLYDAKRARERAADVDYGVDEFEDFQFGFPTAIRLQDSTYLTTHWSVENGVCGIRWTQLRIDW